LKTVITIIAEATGYDVPIHGVSIDEPLNPDFPTSQPQKSVEERTYNWAFDKSFDLALGPHTLYYANTSSYPWKATAIINENNAEMGGVTITAYVSKGNPLILSFNVISHPVYPIFPYLFFPGELYYNLGRGLTYASNCLDPQNPLSVYIDPSKTGHLFMPILETHIYAYKGYTADPDTYAGGGQGLAARGYIWFGIPELNVFQVANSELRPLGQTVAGPPTGKYENGLDLPPPCLICNAQAINPVSDKVTIQCGHVREGADLRNLNWADLIVDSQGYMRPGCIEAVCASGTQPPINYTSTITATLDLFRPLAPILVPGREAYYHVTLSLATGSVGLPYIRIVESPAYWLSEGIMYLDILSPAVPSLGAEGLVVLTSGMISQGYFTVEYGHVIPVSGSSVFMLGQTVKDGELQVPLQYTLAGIRNLQVKATIPPVAASIRRLDVKSTAAAVAAAIRRLDIKSSVASVSAAIRNLDIKTSSGPPPPPPSEYATLMGTVLNFMGQPVANCQVNLIGVASTTTADDGTFEIDNIPVGTYTLIVTPANLFDKLILKGTSMPIDLTLPTGYSQDVTLNLNTLNLAVGGAALFTGIGVAAYETSKPKTYGGYK